MTNWYLSFLVIKKSRFLSGIKIRFKFLKILVRCHLGMLFCSIFQNIIYTLPPWGKVNTVKIFVRIKQFVVILSKVPVGLQRSLNRGCFFLGSFIIEVPNQVFRCDSSHKNEWL